MRTAIITGASTGLGREFVRQLADVFPEVECYWLIARRADRLQEVNPVDDLEEMLRVMRAENLSEFQYIVDNGIWNVVTQ